MINQHIPLERLYISERIINEYAQTIAEEDIKETYGKKAIIPERIYASGQYIF